MSEDQKFNEHEITAFWDEVKTALGNQMEGRRVVIFAARKMDERAGARLEKEVNDLGAKVVLRSQEKPIPGGSVSTYLEDYNKADATIVIAPEFCDPFPSSENRVILDTIKKLCTGQTDSYKVVAFSPNHLRQAFGFIGKAKGGYVKLGNLNAGKDFAEKLLEACAIN